MCSCVKVRVKLISYWFQRVVGFSFFVFLVVLAKSSIEQPQLPIRTRLKYQSTMLGCEYFKYLKV